jgi:hypothetical protein
MASRWFGSRLLAPVVVAVVAMPLVVAAVAAALD